MDQRSCRKFLHGNVPEQFVQGKVHAQKQGDINTRNPKSQETEKFEKGALQWKNFRRLKKK